MHALFDQHPVVPVIVINDAADAVPLAEALLAGGIRIIEVTFRTPAAADAIANIRKALPEMAVGAGTVVTNEQARRAIGSGAQFALAPGVDPETIGIFHGQGVPFVPGIATPTDIQAALKTGCRYLKFFPAGTLGGPAALKAVAAPYASLGVRFCPTGGVNPDNMNQYLALPTVFAVGGTWLATPDEISGKQWQHITHKARTATDIAAGVR